MQAIVILIVLLTVSNGGISAQGDETCPGAILACNTCVIGSTVGRGNDHDCGEGHAGPDVVYQFTLAQASNITLISEADFDADWTLASICDGSTSDLGCFDWMEPPTNPSCGAITHVAYGYFNFSTFLEAGTYYLWIDGFYANSAGNYALELICDSTPTPIPTATPPPGIPGDHCDNAISISTEVNAGSYPQTVLGDSTLAINNYELASCNITGADGPELVYTFTPDVNRALSFDLCSSGGSLLNSDLYVRFGGTCPGTEELTCDDNGCNSPGTDQLSILSCREYLAGVTYYLFVDSASSASPGSFEMTIIDCNLPVCNSSALIGQNAHLPEDFWTAATSDGSTLENLQAYESLPMGSPISICNVKWWGLLLQNVAGDWLPCTKEAEYVIRFYEDAAGQPGALTDSRPVNPQRLDIAISYTDFPLYSFDADLIPCVEITDGWISIQAQESAASPDCWFFWMSSGEGDGSSVSWDGSALQDNYFDLSYCLSDVSSAPTATPTPTATPITGSLVGRVELERPGVTPPHSSWVIDLLVTLCSGGVETALYPVLTDASGNFSVEVLAGTYDIFVKNGHTLANLQSGVLIPEGASTSSIDFGVLREGDANDDNLVTSIDFFTLRNTYNKAPGEPGYDGRADFNEDQVVTSADFFLLKTHYNEAGGGCGSMAMNKSAERKTVFAGAASGEFEEALAVLEIIPAVQFSGDHRSAAVDVVLHTGSQRVNSMDIHLDFDPAAVRVDRITGIKRTGWTEMQETFDNASGTIDYAAVNFAEDSGDFVICRLHLSAEKDIAGSGLRFVYDPVVRKTRVEYDGRDLRLENLSRYAIRW